MNLVAVAIGNVHEGVQLTQDDVTAVMQAAGRVRAGVAGEIAVPRAVQRSTAWTRRRRRRLAELTGKRLANHGFVGGDHRLALHGHGQCPWVGVGCWVLGVGERSLPNTQHLT